MPKSHVVEFQRLVSIPDPRPAKATLRADVEVSVQRSIGKLPVLGQRNPDAALLIERSIDDYMPPPDDDGGHAHSVEEPVIARDIRTPEAENLRRRQIQAEYIRQRESERRAEMMDELLDAVQRDRQRRQSEQMIRMLRDQAGDLSAAS
jgi:hypothetical protein